jgi:hypothetical protein
MINTFMGFWKLQRSSPSRATAALKPAEPRARVKSGLCQVPLVRMTQPVGSHQSVEDEHWDDLTLLWRA